VVPVLGIVGYYCGILLAPRPFRQWFLSEQGVIEILTAVCFGAAGVVGLALAARTRGVVPPLFRVFYVGFALAALFVAFEEISWGQHLFGWQSPAWFAARNAQRETNLHNLFGHTPNRKLHDLAVIVFTMGGIVLPAVARLRPTAYARGRWSHYVLPHGELVALVAMAALLRLFRSMPPSPITGRNLGLAEPMELYFGAAALVYVLILWRRLVAPGVAVLAGALASDRR
jgi:uncharacterized membrane protein YuzA (DUF378 family)